MIRCPHPCAKSKRWRHKLSLSELRTMIGRRRSIENASCEIRKKTSGVTTMHSDGEELSNDSRHTENMRQKKVAQSQIMHPKTRQHGPQVSPTSHKSAQRHGGKK